MDRQTSNITCSKSKNLNASRLVLQFTLPSTLKSVEAGCYSEIEDVVGAAPTGDAPTTSEWSTILLPIKARPILKVLR